MRRMLTVQDRAAIAKRVGRKDARYGGPQDSDHGGSVSVVSREGYTTHSRGVRCGS